jgi:hypothetical protein
MKKGNRRRDEMLDHYDFTGGVRGKYPRRYAEGTNVVVLDPDVARLFPNRGTVNETLLAVAQIVQIQERRRVEQTKPFHLAAAMTGMNANVGSLVLAAMDECQRSPQIGFLLQRITTAFPQLFSEDQRLNRNNENAAGICGDVIKAQSNLRWRTSVPYKTSVI